MNKVVEGIKFIGVWVAIGIIGTPIFLYVLNWFIGHYFGYRL